MRFNSSWSPPFRFTPGKDTPERIENWGSKGKAGIYVIRNWDDTKTLYVGKAEGTSRDIQKRLKEHLSGIPPAGNRGIRNLVTQGEDFTVRWAESRNPALSEAIAIIQLAPQCNLKCEWKELVDRTSDEDCLAEAARLGLISDQPFRTIAEKIVLSMRQQEIAERLQTQQEPVRLLWENEQTQPENIRPLWENEQTQPERKLPLWERNARLNQEKNNYRER